MGTEFTFFVVYGSVTHLVDLGAVEVVERDYPLLTPKEVNAAIKPAAPAQARRRRRLHRDRRAHRRHRRDPQHQGLRGGEGAGVLPRDQGRQPRRAGPRPRARRAVPRRAGRRRPDQPGRHPARRPHPQHDGDVRGLPGGLPRRRGPAPRRRRPPLRGGLGRALGVDRVFGRGTTPGEVASYLVHASTGGGAPSRVERGSRRPRRGV